MRSFVPGISLLYKLALLMLSQCVFAQTGALREDTTPIRFRIVVDAPRPFAGLLENNLDLVRWQGGDRLTRPLLERLVAEARSAASEALAAEGYFSAQVESSIEMQTPTDAVVKLAVQLGPRTRVRKLNLAFEGAAVHDSEGRGRIAAVEQGWSLTVGEPFQQAEWDRAKNVALGRLARGRYAAAKVSGSEARIDPETSSATLTLKLDSGPIFRAGPTRVAGLKRYPESVVENMNPFEPGEAYDALKLDLFQRRLLETGYFNAVQLTVSPDTAQAAAAPLEVSVMEAPSQRIDAGVIFSTDIGPGISIDYSNADAFDSAWRLNSRLKLNAKEQIGHLTFDTPPRPGGVWNTYAVLLERSDVENQISREAIVRYAYNWGLLQVPTQAAISAHFERLSVAGFESENSHAIFLGFRRTFRTTEELIAPREGMIGTMELGVSIPGVSTRTFARTRARVNWLIPAGARNDILVRAEAGIVLASTRSGIPSSFLFRIGGSETVRGYSYQSLGVSQGDAIVGGRYMALAGIEYTRWVTDTLGAAVFVDAGDAFDQRNQFDAAFGAGFGVRWRSPVGPFRADVAYGERAKELQFHFSLGYTF